jgi:hypothetical protein
LVVGIFWTRIGSPSGEADSGTIEEIERASSANKPVMLYFSRAEINPHDIDMEQLRRLKLFEDRVKQKELGSLINQYIRFHQTVPIALLLENIGATGVRNIFAELTYRSTADSTILLTQKPTIDETSDLWSDTIIQ